MLWLKAMCLVPLLNLTGCMSGVQVTACLCQ